jgi:CheY-like chemotaxis protein
MISAIRSVHTTAGRFVLVADDEPVIRALVARVLVELNLVPVLVGDGAAAIAAVEAHRSELVCAVLDTAMPGANGIDAAQVIQWIAPDLAIMLMSGAMPAHAAGRIARLRLAGMLCKPFPVEALRELILQAVSAGAACGEGVGIRDGQLQMEELQRG